MSLNPPGCRCPLCEADLRGEAIPRDLVQEGYYPERCDGCHELSHWGLQVGIYDLDSDRTVSWMCPVCKGTWDRDVAPLDMTT
jgi:hypothetical protein